jgi:hypothetical protein
VCSATLVALPQLSRTPGWRGGRAALAQRVEALLPGLRVAAVTVVAAALVATAFVAGRSTRPAAASGASAPTTTAEASGSALPGGGFSSDVSREFGWSVLHGDVTVTLNRVTATGRSTVVTLEVSGLRRDWSFAGVAGLALTDAAGRQLASGSPLGSQAEERLNLGGGSQQGSIQLSRRVDPNAVAGVTITHVLAMKASNDQLSGTLVDAALKRAFDQSPESQPKQPATCPDCRLQVRCQSCEAASVAGTGYSGGRVTVLLSQVGRPLPGERLGDADIAVSGDHGIRIGSFETTSDNGDTVVQFSARDLATTVGPGQSSMPFQIVASLQRTQVVNGPWRIDQQAS